MKRRLPLSVIIVARNEADRLPRTLASVSWADQIILVDSGSTDGTVEIAAAAGAEVIVHPWEGYSAQKQFALSRARHQWVLWVDADEVVSAQLRDSIEHKLANGAAPRFAAYAVNRRSFYLGRFIRFGGWYPDRKVRLFDRTRAGFDRRQVHEGLRVDGRIGRLSGDLWHYSYRDLDHHVRKTHEMAKLWAEERAGRTVTVFDLTLRPFAKAMKSYVLRAGFLEGWRGLLIAGMGASAVWLKYALLREQQTRMQERRKDGGDAEVHGPSTGGNPVEGRDSV